MRTILVDMAEGLAISHAHRASRVDDPAAVRGALALQALAENLAGLPRAHPDLVALDVLVTARHFDAHHFCNLLCCYGLEEGEEGDASRFLRRCADLTPELAGGAVCECGEAE
jgi:hypothetical protein